MQVIVYIKNGLVFDVEAPANVDVIIRNYDIDNISYNDVIETDESGEHYIEQIW